MKALLAIKKGMTQVFVGDKSVPVTLLEVNNCVVSKVFENGVELGLGKKSGRLSKALLGNYKDLGYVPMFREYFGGKQESQVGDKVEVSVFEEGTKVSISGTTKGKGFTGVVKRWGFHGGPKTHGQSDKWRSPGAIGSGTQIGRVLKNQKMAGRKGNSQKTLNSRPVVKIVDNTIMVAGAVPGNNGDLVVIYSK